MDCNENWILLSLGFELHKTHAKHLNYNVEYTTL